MILEKIFAAIIGLFTSFIRTLYPLFLNALRFAIGIIALAFASIFSLIMPKNKKQEVTPDKQQELEGFFMSRKNREERVYKDSIHARFAEQMTQYGDINREKRRKFRRIDGAWKLASVGVGLLCGGMVQNEWGFFAAVGLGILSGSAVGWVGAVINNYIAKTDKGEVTKVPTKEPLKAPNIAPENKSGNNEVVQKVLSDAAASLQQLDNTIPNLTHPDSINIVSQIVNAGKRIMNQVADKPENLSIAQRIFTYYCPEAVNVSSALVKLESEQRPDIERIMSTQSILQKLVILFESTELELKADDNKMLDIDLRLLDQSLQQDLKIRQ